MMVTISTSGGFIGTGLSREAQVDVDKLPEPLREETCTALSAQALSSLARKSARAGAADYVTYHIVVVEAEGSPTAFDVPETVLAPESLDLFDALMEQGAHR